MADHEHLVKEIVWGGEGGVQPQLRVFKPEDAPDHLRPHPLPACVHPSCIPAAVFAAALITLLFILYSQFFYRPPTPKKISHGEGAGHPILIVDFPPLVIPNGPIASPSSSVTQVEAMLRFAGVKYTKTLGVSGPDAGPMSGRAGFLQRGTLRLSDPYYTIRHLVVSKAIPEALELPEDPAQRAAALAVQRICETDLQAALMFFRWCDSENWSTNKKILERGFGMAWPLKGIMLRQVRIGMLRRAVEQRMARRAPQDILSLVKSELESLDSLLTTNGGPYLFGARPCAADAAAFAVLEQILYAGELTPQLETVAKGFPQLKEFVDYMRAQFFGESYSKEIAWVGSRPSHLEGNKKSKDE